MLSCSRRLRLTALWVAIGMALAVAGLRGSTPLRATSVADTGGTFEDAAEQDHVLLESADRIDAEGPAGAEFSVRQPRKVWSIGRFVNDLRRPRPPRQRSERPVSPVDGVQALLTRSMLKMILMVDLYRPFVSDSLECRPLSGHYRSLLRPPSAFC